MAMIRKMEMGDLSRCAEILEAAYVLPPYNEKFSSGIALMYLKGKFGYCAGHSFVASDEDGTIAGFILVSLSVWVEGGQAVIEEIVVDPAAQRRGYGKALMRKVEECLEEKDVHSVMFWARRDAPAHGFHESNGFEDSDDWVIMHKAL